MGLLRDAAQQLEPAFVVVLVPVVQLPGQRAATRSRSILVRDPAVAVAVQCQLFHGPGHRIGKLEDTELDSDVYGSDVWYDSSFNERWRMVATYRSTDANPKERFVHHQVGAGGDGGSSYIDLVAFREKDVDEAWTDLSDGDLEERLYYCQNQHADVVALIAAAGAQREMVRYSAYGVPIGLPVGDVNSDGACLQTDQNQVRDWALATPVVYDVRGDLDLDGDVDLTDRDTLRDNYKDITLGRTKLSAVGNARGCAGYLAAGFDSTVYRLRHRVLPGELGVWASRDPLGYVDGPNLACYGQSNPMRHADENGTCVGLAASGEPGSGSGCGGASSESCCEMGLRTAQAQNPGKLVMGTVVCCGGVKVICVRTHPGLDDIAGKARERGDTQSEATAHHANVAIQSRVAVHESVHLTDHTGSCAGRKDGEGPPNLPGCDPAIPSEKKAAEREANAPENKCLDNLKCEGANVDTGACKKYVQTYREEEAAVASKNG